MIRAVQQKASSFRHASQALRESEEFVQAALDSNINVLEHVSADFKTNQFGIVARAVSIDGRMIEFAIPTQRRQLLLEAVRTHGEAIRFHPTVQNREVVRMAVQEDGEAFCLLSRTPSREQKRLLWDMAFPSLVRELQPSRRRKLVLDLMQNVGPEVSNTQPTACSPPTWRCVAPPIVTSNPSIICRAASVSSLALRDGNYDWARYTGESSPTCGIGYQVSVRIHRAHHVPWGLVDH